MAFVKVACNCTCGGNRVPQMPCPAAAARWWSWLADMGAADDLNCICTRLPLTWLTVAPSLSALHTLQTTHLIVRSWDEVMNI